MIILLTTLVASELSQLSPRWVEGLNRHQQHFFHSRYFTLRPSIVDLHIISLYIGNQEDFLLEMVKGDELIEQHQIYIGKICLTLLVNLHIRLTIAHEVEAKCANQATGKIGQAFNLRCFILCKNVADAVQGILFLVLNRCATDDFRIAIGNF